MLTVRSEKRFRAAQCILHVFGNSFVQISNSPHRGQLKRQSAAITRCMTWRARNRSPISEAPNRYSHINKFHKPIRSNQSSGHVYTMARANIDDSKGLHGFRIERHDPNATRHT